MKDPMWKIVLNWGAVIVFLTLPLVIFVLQVYHLTHPGWITPLGDKVEAGYLNEFMRNITILVFGLAGLRTWEHIKNGRNNEPPPLKKV